MFGRRFAAVRSGGDDRHGVHAGPTARDGKCLLEAPIDAVLVYQVVEFGIENRLRRLELVGQIRERFGAPREVVGRRAERRAVDRTHQVRKEVVGVLVGAGSVFPDGLLDAVRDSRCLPLGFRS